MYSPSSGTSSGTSCTESIRGTKLDDAVTTYKIIVDLSSLTRRTKSSCLRDNRHHAGGPKTRTRESLTF